VSGNIPEELISQIKERINIIDVVSDFLPLKKVGVNYKGLCPFHSEKTPSFTVNEEKQIFHCFGCGAGGNAITFLMKAGGMTFPDAVTELAKKQGFDVVILDDLKSGEWSKEKPEGSHWKRGFLFPKLFKDADAIVQTCCLKTHRYGGHFTMSLKNSVGMVAKYDPEEGYNYMAELHSSRYQRQMIAEINTAYKPEFVIMDGIAGFSKGGPDEGTLIEPGIMLASRDRVALDAAGVAVLRIYGTTGEVSRGSIFEQEQIARAAELGLGASAPDEIEVVPINEEAQGICSKIKEELQKK